MLADPRGGRNPVQRRMESSHSETSPEDSESYPVSGSAEDSAEPEDDSGYGPPVGSFGPNPGQHYPN